MFVIAEWFKRDHGTPMGILHTMPHTGIFPPVPDDRVEFHEPQDSHSEWTNYKSVEDSPAEVKSLIDEMEANGWCTQFDHLPELINSLKGEQPVFSKLGLISK